MVLCYLVELGLRCNRHLCLHVIFYELMNGIWCPFGMFTVLSCACQLILRLDKNKGYFTESFIVPINAQYDIYTL
jgi:hypothetical protein